MTALRMGITCLVLATVLPGVASAQRCQSKDCELLATALLEQAESQLRRDGLTFCALGAYIDTAGHTWGYTPDMWPDLAPPAAWQDSLTRAIATLEPPARAVAWLVDEVSHDGIPTRDSSSALFHYEDHPAGKSCRTTRLGYAMQSTGKVQWGTPVMLPCRARAL